MNTLDKRKNYYMVLDTETANSLEDPFVYDIGFCICDVKGTVYHTDSMLIYDIYRGERELMQSCYYANKIEMYEKQYSLNMRRMVNYNTARRVIADTCKYYNVKAIIAHNARFDYKSTNTTLRYLTNSRQRYFFPYGIPVWDTLQMAKDTIALQKSYIAFCNEKPKTRLLKNGKVRLTAEILYQYIINDDTFREEHTGLADVLIEKEIFARCMRQHKKMQKTPWSKTFPENPPKTKLQWQIDNLAKYQTV